MRCVLLKRLFSRGKWLFVLWKVLHADSEVVFDEKFKLYKGLKIIW
jgi:hypothetical protein